MLKLLLFVIIIIFIIFIRDASTGFSLIRF